MDLVQVPPKIPECLSEQLCKLCKDNGVVDAKERG